MCFKTKTPNISQPQAAPTRDDTAAAVSDTRRRLNNQQSVYGSIFTSVLGDSNYGRNVQSQRPNQLAALGA